MHTTAQRSLPGQTGRWFYVVDGSWAGYWVRESSAAHLDGGATAALSGTSSAEGGMTVRIRRGTHSGYVFDASGVMQAVKTKTLSGRDAPADALTTLPGQTGEWFHMTGGGWNGYWLRASSVVFVID
jgi:hypothetical protein